MRGSGMRTRRRTRRTAAWACALALAAVTTGACTSSTGTDGAQGASPSKQASAAPTTSSDTDTSCDTEASSAAPSASAIDSKEVSDIKARGVLRVGVSADQYLTGYLGPDGVEEGFDIDLAHFLAKSLFGDPNKVKFVVMSTADRIPDLKASPSSVDLVIDTMTITCERLDEIDFSAVYFEASQRLLVAKGSPYTSIGSLKGQNVCAQDGSTSIKQIAADDAKAVAVTNVSDCLVYLQENRVSAISTDDTLLAGLAEQDPNLAVVGQRLEPEPYGIGIPPGETDVERWVNDELAQYESDGGWARSYAKWFADSLGSAQPPVAQYSH